MLSPTLLTLLSYGTPSPGLATFRVDTDDWKQVYQTDGSCMDKYAVAYDRYVDDDTCVQ